MIGKVWSHFRADLGFREIAILNFTLRLLFELLFTCRLKCYITCYFSLIFLCYIDSLFKGKIVQKLTQMRIKISRISYFSFSFKLNEKKESVVKKYGLERGLQENVCYKGVVAFKEIMNKDRRTYINILADLQAF